MNAKKSHATLSNEYNVFGIRYKHKRGWIYQGRVLLCNLPDYIAEKLRKEGDAATVTSFDRYTQYVHSGTVTASSKLTLIDFYRRFKKPSFHAQPMGDKP